MPALKKLASVGKVEVPQEMTSPAATDLPFPTTPWTSGI